MRRSKGWCSRTSSPSACSRRRRRCSNWPGSRKRRGSCTASGPRRPTTSAGSACWPVASPNPACASSRSPRATSGTSTRSWSSGHEKIARAVDRPISGLLTDLKARGLLDDTLVFWGAEFGRTPYTEGIDGRDHNPEGYSVWLAGGGVKGGIAYGQTDEFGFAAVEDKVHYHDLHATILHLLGLDHERLTYRYSGRDFRLTDVYGRVVHDILA